MTEFVFPEQVKALFSRAKKPYEITVPSVTYLAFNGSGHPNSGDFQKACNALFTISYTLKFCVARKELSTNFKVQPLEVTWHLDKTGGKTFFTWEAMILQPDFITDEMCTRAIEKAQEAGKTGEFSRLYVFRAPEAQAVQALHQGAYTDMNSTLETMCLFAEKRGLHHCGVTHDIYLNDSRKTKTENLQAIMRLIVK